MRLTLDLPATPDEVAAYAEACRLLGGDRIDIDSTGGPPWLVTDLTGTAPAAPTVTVEPPAPATPEPSQQPPRRPTAKPKAAKAAKRTGISGTVEQLLGYLADHDGKWDGSYADLARHAYPANPATAQTELRKIEALKLIAAVRVNNRVRAVALTSKGYQRIGRTAPTAPRTITAVPDEDAPADSTVTADEVAAAVGPITRRPFDHDAARAAAGGGW